MKKYLTAFFLLSILLIGCYPFNYDNVPNEELVYISMYAEGFVSNDTLINIKDTLPIEVKLEGLNGAHINHVKFYLIDLSLIYDQKLFDTTFEQPPTSFYFEDTLIFDSAAQHHTFKIMIESKPVENEIYSYYEAIIINRF